MVKAVCEESLVTEMKSFKLFTSVMVKKLKMNKDKNHWSRSTTQHLLDCLEKEVDELKKAINTGNPLDIVEEAADVANFAYILCSHGINNEDDNE